MTTKSERAIVVSALKHAAPYIRLFKGKVFVIKIGGEVFADAEMAAAIIEQVGILHQVGVRTVLIHGGGPQSTKLAADLGLETQFVEGRRVTDSGSLNVATMILNGQINTRILATCRDLQIPAVGISGVDAGVYGSRGQQRTAALSLKLAEVDLMRRETGEQPVLLLDDVLSELDEHRRRFLVHTLENGAEQAIITTTDLHTLPGAFLKGAHLWRVEMGRLSRIEAEGPGASA
jgi:hypothetical protein